MGFNQYSLNMNIFPRFLPHRKSDREIFKLAVMSSVKLLVLVLLSCLHWHAEAAEYFVHPFPCHPGAPCKTLQDYMQDAADYFTPSSTFVFLEGEHYLNTQLDLGNATYMIFRGIGSGDTEIIVSPEAGIFFTNSRNIEFESLKITNTGQENDVSNIALNFSYSNSIQLTNILFMHINHGQSRSRAIHFSYSSAEIINCSFSNGYIKNGGVIEAYASDLTFSGQTLFDNNTADFSGGAIYATNSLLIFYGNCSFSRNRAGTGYYPKEYDIGGGAICALQTNISFNGNTEFVDNGPIHFVNNALIGSAILAIQDSTLTIAGNSIFCNNTGYTGGGLFLVNSTCFISGISTFLKNSATKRSGGAIFSYRSMIYIDGSIQFTKNHAMESGGGILMEHSILKSEGEVNFIKNSVDDYAGGATALISSIFEISGMINFNENRASYGGALAFLGSSQIEFESLATVNFLRNEAVYGGAIHVTDSIPRYATQCQNVSVEPMDCFFRVQAQDTSFEDIHLNFTENFVQYSGASIYGGAIELCRVRVNGIQTAMNGYQFLQNVSIFKHQKDENSYISSKPLKVCSCYNGTANCSLNNLFINITIEPGRTFDLSVLTVGQLGMPEPSNIVNIFSSSNGSEIRPQSYNAFKTTMCHNVGFQLFTSNPVEHIQVYPEGCNSYNGSLFITVSVKNCPPGFKLIDNGCSCEERLKNITEKGACDIETGLIRRPNNAWIKPLFRNQTYVGFLWSLDCYIPYCRDEDSLNPTLLNFSSPNVDSQCEPNRTGILCGSCKENHSLVMYKLHCDICEDRFLSLIIFFLFAGMALIAILLLLQMTVAKGTINGLILYCNFIDICSPFFFPLDEASVTPLSIFISWVNLNFGIPTCFYDGLNSYSYTWLQFAFPLYLWVLIGTIIIACKISSSIGSLFGSNPVAVLATVILLSFTKVLQTVVDALSYQTLQNPDGSEVKRWGPDPNIPFFSGKHIPLAVFSLCVIIFLLVPYICLLLFGYRLQKYSGNKGFRWFNKFTPLLDAYYAPFSKNGRYWSGFMVLIRSCLFLSFTITPLYENNASLIVSSSLFIAVAIFAWVSGPIHENLYIEILEATFILNICVLPIVSYHIDLVRGSHLIVTYVSVAIAFAEFVGIVIFHVLFRVSKIPLFKNLQDRYFMCLDKVFKQRKTKKHPAVNVAEMGPEEASVAAIREPLLEDATIL